jgi:hypothetical protein
VVSVAIILGVLFGIFSDITPPGFGEDIWNPKSTKNYLQSAGMSLLLIVMEL